MSNESIIGSTPLGYAITIALVLVVIVYFVAIEHEAHAVHRKFIEGYWDASATFCERSGIESAQVYFRDDTVYLLLDEGDHIVLKKCVDVAFTPVWWGDCVSWRVKFAEEVDPLPQECELRLDPERGMIGLFQDETLYLELFKNTKATAGVV